jgi:hypothetical protein
MNDTTDEGRKDDGREARLDLMFLALDQMRKNDKVLGRLVALAKGTEKGRLEIEVERETPSADRAI